MSSLWATPPLCHCEPAEASGEGARGNLGRQLVASRPGAGRTTGGRTPQVATPKKRSATELRAALAALTKLGAKL